MRTANLARGWNLYLPDDLVEKIEARRDELTVGRQRPSRSAVVAELLTRALDEGAK